MHGVPSTSANLDSWRQAKLKIQHEAEKCLFSKRKDKILQMRTRKRL
jgi:hypothetical protein